MQERINEERMKKRERNTELERERGSKATILWIKEQNDSENLEKER